MEEKYSHNKCLYTSIEYDNSENQISATLFDDSTVVLKKFTE